MSFDGRRREELRRATAEAAAAARRELAAADAAQTRRPGDLVLLPATAEQGVEWLLAERDGDRWLLVPADVDPWVGSGDHQVPADDDGGPLVLRCRHALWADARVLAGAVAGGHVDPAHAAAAAARHRQAAAGGTDGSPLERETDEDPVYRRRDAEVATARAVLAGAALAAEQERQRRRFGDGFGSAATWRAVAAVLLVALAGSGWWAAGLHDEVVELSRPIVLDAAPDLRVGGPDRSPDPVELVRRDGFLFLRLLPDLDDGVYRVRVVSADGRELLSRDLELGRGASPTLALPAATTPPGPYELQLLDPATSPPALLHRYRLTVPAR